MDVIGKSEHANFGFVRSQNDKKLRQGYVDLKKATFIELQELISRQDKLLQRRLFIEKLPDKGKKIIAFREEIQNELTNRLKLYNSTCDLLSALTLDDLKSEDFEWSGRKIETSEKKTARNEEEDFNAIDSDPLKILTSHSGLQNLGKTNVPFTLDLNKKNQSMNYINKLCEKMDSVVNLKERFKPNQLVESKRHLVQISSEKLKKRLGDKWEVTEATPPIFNIQNTKPVSLKESIFLQEEHAKRLWEIEKKYASEKLKHNANVKIGQKLPLININEYRNIKNVFDETVSDEENDEKSDSDEN